jgi:hypothetical protein
VLEQRLGPFRPPSGSQPGARAARDEVRTLLKDGLVRTVIADVVISAVEPVDQRVRAEAAGLLIPQRCRDQWVVGFASAAWVHCGYHEGLEQPRPEPPALLEVVVAPGFGRPTTGLLRGRQAVVSSAEITRLHGVRITTPVRTAADVARDLPPLQALTLLHHLGEAAGVTPGQVLRQLSRMRYARGSAQARPVVRAWAECA